MSDKTGIDYVIERYEEAMSIQINRRQQFSRRAMKLSRIILVMLGVSATGISILARSGGSQPSYGQTGPGILFVGVVVLLVALGFAIFSAKVTVLMYFPPRELERGRDPERYFEGDLEELYNSADEGKVTEYYEAVTQFNQDQLRTPAIWLDLAYASLFVGTIWVITGLLLTVIQGWSSKTIPNRWQWILVGLLLVASASLIYVFCKEVHRKSDIWEGEIVPSDDELLTLVEEDDSGEDRESGV